jgi:pimeloyl-ACP methyl ester carboxylesterase
MYSVARIVFGLFLSAVTVSPALSSSTTPVVFIPGFAGSTLCQKDPPKKRVWPGTLDHKELRLPLTETLNPSTLKHEPCGILRELARFVKWPISDQYGMFVDHLKAQLAGDAGVLEFAYDWRLSVEYNAKELKRRLDSTKGFAGRDFDIVAHSFGGLIARYYIQNLGGGPRVRRLITMGAPQKGSVKTFEMLYEGWDNAAVNLWMGGAAEIRKSLLSFPGFYDLLPSYDLCCWFTGPMGERQFSAFDPAAWQRFSWYNDVFSSDADRGFLKFQLQRARALHRDTLWKDLPPPHDTEHRLIVTGFIETTSRVQLEEIGGGPPNFIRTIGDGTVTLLSSSAGRQMGDKALVYSPGQHMRLFASNSAKEAVARMISDGIAPVGGEVISLSVITKEGISIPVQRLSISLSPEFAGPGDTLNFALNLVGSSQLGSADLSNVSARFETTKGPTKIQLTSTPANSFTAVSLIGSFTAPSEPGFYLLRVSVPGLPEEYQDVFQVLDKP